LTDDKGLKLNVTDNVGVDLVINGDAVRLRQILWNLLSNAIKFTNEGHISLVIDEIGSTDALIAEGRDHVIHFSIEDTGVGIELDRLDAIFDAFTQEDSSTTRRFGGTGLGLSIVKQLIDLMDGDIVVESNPGVGTRFDVYLPFDTATDVENGVSYSEFSPSNCKAVEPLNVLVAEDNEINALIARAFLEKLGHRVRHVTNGKLAVQAVVEGWADMVLMDIHMPEMNGMDATKLIRVSKTKHDLPIVGLTAEAFAERHAEFLNAGMDGVLTKPFTEEQLATVLAKYGRGNEDKGASTNLRVIQAEASGRISDTGGVSTTRSSEPTLANNPVGDADLLESIRHDLGDEALTTLLMVAQKSLHDRSRKLRGGLDSSNSDLIRESAHSIKGACGSMGASRVSELAAVIEEKAGDLNAIIKLMPEFEEVTNDTIDWWFNYLPLDH
jgi:CheY-like chemotaxis protein/HPt (histidine-containing phosphotransfer) domain-containing protein